MYPIFICALRCIFILKKNLDTFYSPFVAFMEFMLDYFYYINILIGIVLFIKTIRSITMI